MKSIHDMIQGMTYQEGLVVILGVAGLIWYYVCLFSVGLNPTPASGPGGAFRQFESLSITTISVSLATFIGSLLGTTKAAGEIKSESPGIGAAPSVRETLGVSQLQWACVGLYVLSLGIAIYFWYRGRDKTDSAISNLAKSLLGLVGGALSIALKPS